MTSTPIRTQARGAGTVASAAGPVEGWPEVTARLGEEISAVEGAFTAAADALLDGREGLRDLGEILAGYQAGLADMSGDTLVAAMRAMMDRLAETGERFAEECTAIERIDGALQAASVSLTHLQERVRTLDYFTSTARVVEAEFGLDQRQTFSQQIRLLSERSRAGYQELQQCNLAMSEQCATVRSRQRAFRRSGLRELEELSGELGSLSAAILPGLAKAAEEARLLSALVDQAAAKIGAAISALQVGDSFRQRLEHVVQALRAGAESGAAERALIARIAAAQLRAAGQVLWVELGRLATTMGVISDETTRLVDRSRALVAQTEIALLLERLQSLSGVGLARLYALQGERRLLDDQLQQMRATLADMDKVMADQARVDAEMKLGSYNVSLRSRRSSGKGAAMACVARQTGELIDDCLAARRDIIAEIEVIRRASVGAVAQGDGRMSGKLDKISDTLAGLNGMLGLWRDLGGSIARLSETGPVVIAAFSRCAAGMRGQSESRAVLEDLAAVLERDLAEAAPGESDWARLLTTPEVQRAAAAMRALYSVPEEREIHDRICPPGDAVAGATESAATPSPDEEDEAFEWF